MSLKSDSRAWPSEASDEEGSVYRKRFRQGAILVPRRLTLVERVSTGALPANPQRPLVRGRTGNQDKDPWKTVAPPRLAVERAFLRPALLGESVAAFRVVAPVEAVVPWDEGGAVLLDAEAAARRGYRYLARWLEQAEGLWVEHGRGRRTLLEQYDYFGQLSAQFPLAPVRLVYTKAGKNLVAAVARDRSAVIDHKLYWGAVGLAEARYLCAILNSEAVRTNVEQYQSQGQWGARDFDKYVFNLPIPAYDRNEGLHRRLSVHGRGRRWRLASM